MSTRSPKPDDFPWIGDAARWMWLVERVEGGFGEQLDPGTGEALPALSHTVPSGYDALVRILHPFARSRPATGTWDEYRAALETTDYEAWPDSVSEDVVRWRDVAAAHGRAFAPGSLSHELLGVPYGEDPERESADGWEYSTPMEGSPDEQEFVAVARILAERTETPDRGVVAVWEGYGGLVSAQGVGFYTFVPGEGPGTAPPRGPRWWRRLVDRGRMRRARFTSEREHFGTGPAIRDLLQGLLTWDRGDTTFAPFAGALQQRPGSGILTREAASGPRLDLPGRAYVCFEAGARDFADPAWPLRAPWMEAEQGFGTRLPNLLWPEGREWVLVSEIDFDSTLVACSRACADALLTSLDFEAVEITRDTPLWSTVAGDADEE
ncbi:hypothetical protein BMH31_06095 [Leucobacter sp. OLIS6]|uniref:hypothetical protein n=1 Tax=unclassified Leucobacter TaxID=2621730 RepID=UPI000C184C06|nr:MULTISPECIES: hypothetical protein [unclassified Leucobacter]PII85070.1 hypothetical protein BMH25_02850 [Leucobacter sp. OLCALW19]PII89081.1 hypothetical protein BMH26_04455 [Leucobacter sp. OLTLW20]PII93513.1 hypothetical protein BMH27_03150 [Leucobacter sp. OLAS13]PII98092.1 hypothetical protein BMH29_09600 [Leucobacter sp. OLDS2]PIJ02613.1 hypothetical protein BMH28_04720 [Leucobacter sp. OLCS4]